MSILKRILATAVTLLATLSMSPSWGQAGISGPFSSGTGPDYIAVTGVSVQDTTGSLLANGSICFLATDQNDTPIPVKVNGGGVAIIRNVCASISAGVIQSGFQVANPSQDQPANHLYRVQITDTDAGTMTKFPKVWVDVSPFDWDNYIPSTVGLPAMTVLYAVLPSIITPGTCGDSTHVAQVTTTAQGLTSACTPVAINFPLQSYPAAGLAASTSGAWRAPLYTDVTALFGSGSCSGFLKSDGTCVAFTTPTFQRNGIGLANQATINFNDATPAPPANTVNVLWQTDPGGDLSAYAPAASTQLTPMFTAPAAGQFVIVYPTAVNVTVAANSISPHVTTTGGFLNSLPYCTFGGQGTVVWSAPVLPSYVNPANVTAIYAFTNSENLGSTLIPGATCLGVGYSYNVANFTIQAIGTGIGNFNVNPVGVYPFTQENTLLTGFNAANFSSLTMTANALVGGDIMGNTVSLIQSLGYIVYYTGPAPPPSSTVNVVPPLYYDPASQNLGITPTAQFPGTSLVPTTIAGLPPANVFTNWTYTISNGATTSDCTTGGGENLVMCRSNGTTWVAWAGSVGPAGPAGANGTSGVDGAPGAAATVTVGTTTTGAAGTSASATNSGSSSAAVINFTIPQGAAGAAGATGATGPNAVSTATTTPISGVLKGASGNVAQAASPDIVAMFGSGTCSGYLKSDGTCSIPSSMVYPSAGLAASNGSAWTSPLYSQIVATFGSGSCVGYLKSDGTCSNPSAIASSIINGSNVVLTGSSFLVDDSFSTLGAVTTATAESCTSGGLCTITDTNTYRVGQWIDMHQGWTCPGAGASLTSTLGYYGTGESIYQVLASGLSGSSFKIQTPCGAGSGSGGTIQDATGYMSMKSLLTPAFANVSSVYLRNSMDYTGIYGGITGTICDQSTNFAKMFSDLYPTTTGKPLYILEDMTSVVNDIGGRSETEGQMETCFASVMSQAHAVGAFVVASPGVYIQSIYTSFVTYSDLANWVAAQAKTSTNVASGVYWDYLGPDGRATYPQSVNNPVQSSILNFDVWSWNRALLIPQSTIAPEYLYTPYLGDASADSMTFGDGSADVAISLGLSSSYPALSQKIQAKSSAGTANIYFGADGYWHVSGNGFALTQLVGAATAPTGSCTTTGAWQLTQDGQTRYCNGTWQAPSGVTTFNGRTGAVVPTTGDYTAAQVTNAVATNSANTINGGTQEVDALNSTVKAVVLKGSAGAPPVAMLQANLSNNSTTLVTGTLTAGATMVVTCHGDVSAHCTITDSQSNSYTDVCYDGSRYDTWVATGIVGGADTITVSDPGSDLGPLTIDYYELSQSTVSGTPVCTTNGTNAMPWTTPTTTLSAANGMLIAGYVDGGGYKYISGGTTNVEEDYQLDTGYIPVSASGPASVTWTTPGGGIASGAPAWVIGFVPSGTGAQVADLQTNETPSGAAVSGIKGPGFPYIAPTTYALLNAALPCTSTAEGATGAVTDSAVTTGIITGGGSFHEPAYCNGTNWIVQGGGSGGSMTYPSVGLGVSTGTAWRAPLYTDITALFGSGSCSGYLKSDGTCATPSGGSSSSSTGSLLDGGTMLSPLDVVPSSPNAMNDEFNSESSIGSIWTSSLIGSATATFLNSNSLEISTPAHSSDSISYLTQPVPSTPWTVVTKVRISASAPSSAGVYCGIVLPDGTGKFVWYTMVQQGGSIGWSLQISYMTNQTSFSSSPGSSGNNAYTTTPVPWIYLQAQDTGSNLVFSYSFDGITFYQLSSLSRTAWLSAGPTKVGIGSGTFSGGNANVTTFDWFRRTQ